MLANHDQSWVPKRSRYIACVAKYICGLGLIGLPFGCLVGANMAIDCAELRPNVTPSRFLIAKQASTMSAFRLTFGVIEIVGVGVKWGWGVSQFLNSLCSQPFESFRLLLHWSTFLNFSQPRLSRGPNAEPCRDRRLRDIPCVVST